jgi:urea transporter
MRLLNFINILCKGFGQVMLQDNALTGSLFFAGIVFNSRIMAILALIGVISSTWTAFLLNFPKNEIEKGLYGFNGVLVGIALAFFFQYNLLLVLIIVMAAALSSLIMRFMVSRKISAFTFPFIASTWIFYFIINSTRIISKNVQSMINQPSLDVAIASANGIGQVMFQQNVITGIIFVIAIIISSRTATVYAFAGTLFGFAAATALGLDKNLINAGIFGFNAVLCGIAFAKQDVKSAISAFIAIVLSIFIVIFWTKSISFPMLTFPFVLATWIVIFAVKLFSANFKNTKIGS